MAHCLAMELAVPRAVNQNAKLTLLQIVPASSAAKRSDA